MSARWLWLAPLLALLSACGSFTRGGGYFQDDGPESNPPADVANIPDAVPKREARSASGNNPYAVYGVAYKPLATANGYRERGIASWYGKKFHRKRTSSGEAYDMYAMTAAHKTLPLPCYVRVRNLQNGRSAVVRVNDRGPFLNNRLIDLSYAAAAKLGIIGTGTGIVEVEAINPDEPTVQVAKTSNADDSVQIIPYVMAGETPPTQVAATQSVPAPAASTQTTAVAEPKLYLQVGAFTVWDNAATLRDRLEREALRPIFIQSSLNTNGNTATRIFRVRVGPLANVEEGDRLSARATQLGVSNPLIVVE
ncbi:MAG: septal ring lytic transglycosylase RlpA family protein [Gammaproteobacteria bacterium]|nr:septal ring lytic transglycosylase RlpA family protein [Gammaproteobacteria bacterium]